MRHALAGRRTTVTRIRQTLALAAATGAGTRSERAANKSQGGFTLIELMTVVVILGVLAAVAVGGYMQQVRNARKSEVLANMSQLSLRQRTFLSVAGHYASSTNNEGPDYTYPTGTVVTAANNAEIPWDITDTAYTASGAADDEFTRGGGNLHGFDALRFMPEGGHSRCGYATVSGYGTNAMDSSEADEPPSELLANSVFPSGVEGTRYFARDWFYSYALCDFDADGTFWAFTSAHYTSDVHFGNDASGTYLEGE